MTRDERELGWRGGREVILSFVGFDVGIGGFACEKPRYIKAEPDGIVGRVCDSVTGGYEDAVPYSGSTGFLLDKLRRLRNCKELAAMMTENNYVGCCKADL